MARVDVVICPNHGVQTCGCYRCDAWKSVPMVPADAAAVERGREYLCSVEFSALPHFGGDRKAIAKGFISALASEPTRDEERAG